MKISCIIPTKDRRHMVMRAIASVYAQQVDGLEIVVVDDGSMDGTAKALRERHPAVKVVELSGVGPGPARNAGVEAACGDVLMFLDSDDIWLQGHVESLVCVLNRRYSVAYGTAETIDEVQGGSFLIPEQGAGMEGDCFKALVRWCFLIPSATAVRREAFYQVSGFNTGLLAEDWAFFLDLAKYYPFGFAGSQPIATRYLHKGSLCHLSGIDRIISGLQSVKRAMMDCGHHHSEAIAGFCRMEQWVREQGKAWNTVQEWYTAMRKEGIL